jgi:hypothetical protein
VKALVQKEGDTQPALWRTNISLLNSTVDLKVKDSGGTYVTTTGNVTILDPYVGIISWDHGGGLTVGSYSVELWITRDGQLFKAPSEGFGSIRITADLVA